MSASTAEAGSSTSSATPPVGTTPLDDTVRTIVALAIVFVGLIVIVGAWALRSASDAEALSSVMTGLMGGVLGYYFGASGKAKSDADADKAKASEKATTTRAGNALAKLAEAKGKLKVTGTHTGGVVIREKVSGAPKDPIDAAIHDLEEATSALNPP